MAEYIEREEALMIAKILVHTAYTRTEKIKDTEIEKAINDIPAADVVEVVRCKGCRYFYNGSMKCCTNHAGVVLTGENGFCHHAKRIKDEGGNA